MLRKKKRKIEEVHKSTHYPPLEKNGNEYYSVEGLVNADCHINICVGGRESGKTTDIITSLMMYDAVKNGNKFIFVRNLQEEITQKKLVKYFNAIRYEAYPELACFNNIFVSAQKEIWIRKIGEDNQIVDELQVGIAYSIEKALSNKSMTVERNMYNK